MKALEVSLVEVHGTGTSLGDPIEVGGMKSTLGKGRTEDAPLVLAATKSIIGHTEGFLHGTSHDLHSSLALFLPCVLACAGFLLCTRPRFCGGCRPHQDDW